MTQYHYSSMFAPKGQRLFFEHEERKIAVLDDFFWKSFDYISHNHIAGDYLEFGCGGGVFSFRLAAKYRSSLSPHTRIYAFDSFQGLPSLTELEIHPGWEKGSMAVDIASFHELMHSHGHTRAEYSTVPGFFKDTLYGAKPATFGIEKAAFVFVDCDISSSARLALDFVADTLDNGAILAFDDWYCYGGDPDRGEQGAFKEFCAQQPALTFIDFLPFGWHGRSFLVHRAILPG
jgi:O-methyltransferase